MSECVVTSFCPASQLQAHITLANIKHSDCLVMGKPVECRESGCCGKTESVKCYLKVQRLTTRIDRK
jgi:hypothetical protein